MRENMKIKRLNVPGDVFIMRVTPKLRLIFRQVHGAIEIVDIVTQDRLERMYRYAHGVR